MSGIICEKPDKKCEGDDKSKNCKADPPLFSGHFLFEGQASNLTEVFNWLYVAPKRKNASIKISDLYLEVWTDAKIAIYEQWLTGLSSRRWNYDMLK